MPSIDPKDPYAEAFDDPYEAAFDSNIPKTENFLQKAMRSSQEKFGVDPLSGVSGGFPAMFGGARNAEDVVPGMAQFTTDFAMKATPQTRLASIIPGVNYGATVGATGASEFGRQGVKALRGEGFNLGEAGKNTAISAGVEGLSRGSGGLFLRSSIGKELTKQTGRTLGKAKDFLIGASEFNPQIGVAKNKLLELIRSQVNEVRLEVGPHATKLKSYYRQLQRELPDFVSPEDTLKVETNLGNLAEFVDPTKPKSKVANKAIKKSRSYISELNEDLDKMASMSVGKESKLGESSKAYSIVKKFYPDKKPTLQELIAGQVGRAAKLGGIGTIVGALTQNPLLGAGVALVELASEVPAINNFLYNMIVKSGASRAGRVGVSEVLRRNS